MNNNLLGQDPLAVDTYFPQDFEGMLARVVRIDRATSESTATPRRRFQLRLRMPVVVAIASLAGASLAGAGLAVAASGGRAGHNLPNPNAAGRETLLSIKPPALTHRSGVAPRSMGTLPLCTSDSNWSSEGSYLLSFQQAHPTTNDGPDGTTTQAPYAYESLPIDFTGDGTYTVDFGPVPTSFNPGEWAYQTPNDFEGSVYDASRASLEAISGSTFDQAQVVIVSPSADCSGLTIWIY